MGLRFFRRFTILPGIRLNVSKQGISASAGSRGASVTVGKRGVYANLGLPGTGLSYRNRLDSPRSMQPPEPESTQPIEPGAEAVIAPDSSGWGLLRYQFALSSILRDRELGIVDWQSIADPGERPEDEESDDFFEFARRLARARLARRVLEGDDAAWAEALYEELSDEVFPFGFDFDFEIEDDGHVRLVAYLPDPACIPTRRTYLEGDQFRYRRIGKKEIWEEYEDVCCAILLRMIHETFRVLPGADELHATGVWSSRSPATGQEETVVMLRVATDRDTFLSIDLDHVDPSSAYDGLGGAKRLGRLGELHAI